jgi:hypothetical protein
VRRFSENSAGNINGITTVLIFSQPDFCISPALVKTHLKRSAFLPILAGSTLPKKRHQEHAWLLVLAGIGQVDVVTQAAVDVISALRGLTSDPR